MSPRPRLLATGFGFTEGPLYHPTTGEVIFSDLLHDVRRAWHPHRGVRVLRRPTNLANGLALDAVHRLLACEHATSRVTREADDGTVETVASHWQGRELNSPNDLIVGADGDVYFTDPTYGRRERLGVPREQQLDFQGVYRVDPDGRLHLLATDFAQPNGICLSPDAGRLYVADTQRAEVRSVRMEGPVPVGPWSVLAAGLSDARRPGRPDGLLCSRDGEILVTGPGGIHVLDPAGRTLRVIHVPEKAHNMTWGGADRRDLYIAAGGSLYHVRLPVGGVPDRPTRPPA
ncbi:SMP-30/gluconolactonase/LRE family protein [Micromonospora sp. NPDC049900]|uniref:SMP-30/gluconolactonase/LRE family protein n=1 Tax=unclassified Micromonospora TaxID=2617518 RepID=UPI0037930C37